jgi:hypothetical protein
MFHGPSPTRKVTWQVAAMIALFGLAACAANGASITSSQAAAATRGGGNAVFRVFFHTNVTGAGPVSFSSAGVNMTGTVSTNPSMATCQYAITLSDYLDSATGYTVSGTINFIVTVDLTSGAITGTSTATLSLSGGVVTKVVWNVGVTGSASRETLDFNSGTTTCDGTMFDVAALGL